MNAPAQRQNLTERIYRQLKQDIVDFHLLPGDRFSENTLARRLNVSRTPVREALSQLQREGFVTVSFRSGWQVNPLDFEQFDQLYELRIVLELAAVQKLCEKDATPNLGTLPELAVLKRDWLIDESQRSQDQHRVCAMDEDFHKTLVAATGNREMARVHSDITDRLRVIRRIDFSQPARITATYEEHAHILRAILTRRSDLARTLLKNHIETSKAEVRKITLHKLYEIRQSPKNAAGHWPE